MSEMENCELECGAYGPYCKCTAEKAEASECPPDACCSTANEAAIIDRLKKLIDHHKALLAEPESMAMVSRDNLINQLEITLSGELCR